MLHYMLKHYLMHAPCLHPRPSTMQPTYYIGYRPWGYVMQVDVRVCVHRI